MKSNEIETWLTEKLDILYPVIMAPMFLVSNTKMLIEARKAGITGAIPALNFRSTGDFRKALSELQDSGAAPFGVNLIANRSNVHLKDQLKACLDLRVDYIITSLGDPKKIIDACHKKGILVFCDVIDEKYAKKVERAGADALIAVNSGAGGHPGYLKADKLISRLLENTKLPVISAGGVATGTQLKEMLDLGACGVSMGTRFIATEEAGVSLEYKEALLKYKAEDVVRTTKISGTPLTVINTPFVQETGTRQNALEAFLNKNKRIKKYAKMLTFYKGMKLLRKAAFNTTYKSVWCAGPGIEYINEILPVQKVVENLIGEFEKDNGK
jgi:nitronate monooxygenase